MPLNPPPDRHPTDDPEIEVLYIRFVACNACGREFAPGDDVFVFARHDPNTGEAVTIAHHEPACPDPA